MIAVLPPAIAPIKCAVLPLVKNKPELVEQAKQIFNDLKFSFQCQYDDKDAIGRRYRRQDAIGTPFCVTIDFETMSDHSVTIRERDSLLQERVLIKDLANLISNKIAWQNLFK